MIQVGDVKFLATELRGGKNKDTHTYQVSVLPPQPVFVIPCTYRLIVQNGTYCAAYGQYKGDVCASPELAVRSLVRELCHWAGHLLRVATTLADEVERSTDAMSKDLDIAPDE